VHVVRHDDSNVQPVCNLVVVYSTSTQLFLRQVRERNAVASRTLWNRSSRFSADVADAGLVQKYRCRLASVQYPSVLSMVDGL